MILYFSGTGNSQAVATLLASELGDTAIRIRPGLRQVDLSDGDGRIIWVFPVHSWGVPPFVKDFIACVTFNRVVESHHLVVTCGDDCGETAGMWRDCLKERGWSGRSAHSVEMPNTYVSMPFFDVDSPQVRERKLSHFPARVEEIAGAIRQDGESETDDVVRGSFARFKSGVIYPWFMRHAVNPRKFKVDGRCIGCGACGRACPVGNVSLRDSLPVWGDFCTGCLACYHVCPRHAVSYGSFTRGKGQYYFKGSDRKA